MFTDHLLRIYRGIDAQLKLLQIKLTIIMQENPLIVFIE